MQCTVEVAERPEPQAGGEPQSWELVRDAIRRTPPPDDLAPARMSEPTPLVPLSEAARAYAAPSLAPGRDWLEAVGELMRRIHADFEFVPGATTVSTSVDEVLHKRCGVCQDFAHLLLACLRAHGLPARYVSGYLLTNPAPGQPRLMGVDASHAWVAAWSPRDGWVEFDPTNDLVADHQLLRVAVARVPEDASPVTGSFTGPQGSFLELSVGVVIEPVEVP